MRVTFFRVAERKSPKKGRPYCARPFAALRATCDARTEGAPQNSLRATRSVQTTAASQCTKCVCPSAHARPPCPALLGARRREPQNAHPHGPLLRCAALGPNSRAQAPRAARAKPSAAMARMDVRLFGCSAVRLSTPCWLCLRRGGCGVSMGVGAPIPRQLTRRGCLSGARSAKRVPRRTPQPTRRRFAPSHSEGVADWGSPFFWVLFFGEAKKSTSPAGATPGLRPRHKHACGTSTPKLREAQTERIR